MTGAKLGQNFLVDPRVADKIIDRFLPAQGPIMEIGPGRGILTDRLIRKAEQRITAVELDDGLCGELEIRYGGRADVICGDILDIRLERLFPSRPVNVIGNLPYCISRELVDWLIQNGREIRKGIVMLQKEFVQKLVVGQNEPASSAQAAMFDHLFTTDRLFSVHPGSFSPRPRVTSIVLAIARKGDTRGPDPDFYRFLRSCFRERRKTLWNNLSPHFEKDILASVFTAGGLTRETRVEELPADRLYQLFHGIKKWSAATVNFFC